MIEWLAYVWDWVITGLWFVWEVVWRFVRRNPYVVLAALYAFARMWGTVVHTGQAGVLFTWGRASRVLEPGFTWLIPIVHRVRKLPIRSISLDLPRQRLASADGLVFEVDATLVCRITDPIKATTEIDDLRAGCITVLSLAVHEVLRQRTGGELAGRAALDAEIAARVQQDLTRWGVTVEQTGLNSIAPTRTTTRLSQQGKRLRERAATLRWCLEQGLPLDVALPLLGTTRQVVSRAHARYRRRRVKAPAAPTPVAPSAVVLDDDEPLDDDLPV